MLQIILAIIGISMVSVIGFVTIEMLAVQSIAQDQRENTRRLDIAAESLQGKLARLPGVDTLLAPVPDETGSWARLPAGIGALNSNMKGVPFLYCPVADLNADSSSAIIDPEVSSVQMPESNYSMSKHAGLVVDTGLVIDTDVASLRPAAFIVSAGRNVDAPPGCDQIRMINGRAVVENGLVRVVGLPLGIASTSNGIDAAAEFFVSDAGGGDGTSISKPTTIDAALRHFVRYNPSNMTIHVSGIVYPRGAAWASFASISDNSGAKFKVVGRDANAQINVAAAGSWSVPASTVLENVAIAGPQIIVGSGDTLYSVGNVSFAPFNSPPSAMIVRSGGEFIARNSNVNFALPGRDAIAAEGSVYLRQANLLSGGGQVSSFVNLLSGSELSMDISSLGSSTVRPTDTGVRASGPVSVYSDGGSAVYASTGNGRCWTWTGADITFKWSNSGPGARSMVRSETDFPAPAADADPAIVAAYNAEFNERHRARRINGSNMLCS